MWQVSVPSWDQDESPTTPTGKGTGGSKKRKKSASGDASEASSQPPPELFQLKTSLDGEAAAQVTRVIAEDAKKRKRKTKKTQTQTATSGTSVVQPSTPQKSPRKPQQPVGQAQQSPIAKRQTDKAKEAAPSTEDGTPQKRKRGKRGGANRKKPEGSSDVQKQPKEAGPAAEGAKESDANTPKKRKRGKRGGQKSKKATDSSTNEDAVTISQTNDEQQGKSESKPPRKKARKEKTVAATEAVKTPTKQRKTQDSQAERSPKMKSPKPKSDISNQKQQAKSPKANNGQQTDSIAPASKATSKAERRQANKKSPAKTIPDSPRNQQQSAPKSPKTTEEKGKVTNTKAKPAKTGNGSAAAVTPPSSVKQRGQAVPTTDSMDLDHLILEHLGKVTPSPATQPITESPKPKDKAKAKKELKRFLQQAQKEEEMLKNGSANQKVERGRNGDAARRATNDKTAKQSTVDELGPVDQAASQQITRGPALSKFQKKMQARLSGSRFRWINEQLYTTTGNEALRLIKKEPTMFEEYHKGFARQVELWPENPVDVFIAQLKAMPKNLVIADMGCGDAKIAQSVKQKVHSFDLASPNKWVTACDIAKVPLAAQSVNIVIFCLSLMGTNLVDFINEAHRILVAKGTLKIAEVKSRFEDVEKFVLALYALGFDRVSQDDHNKMFILFEFKKSDRPVSKKVNLTLKPCLYKKR